jgi:ATP-dependent RNA helicase RhlB
VTDESSAAPTAAVAPDGTPTDTTGAPRKRRRRRGGRGRRRDGEGAAAETTGTPVRNEQAGAGRGERRPPRERHHGGDAGNRPSRQVAVQSGKPVEATAAKKPGFFRRLTRLFTGR